MLLARQGDCISRFRLFSMRQLGSITETQAWNNVWWWRYTIYYSALLQFWALEYPVRIRSNFLAKTAMLVCFFGHRATRDTAKSGNHAPRFFFHSSSSHKHLPASYFLTSINSRNNGNSRSRTSELWWQLPLRRLQIYCQNSLESLPDLWL